MEDKKMAAFPCPMSEQSHINQDCAPFQSGMTLRDYFAAKAMQGYIASGGDIDIDGAYFFEKRAKGAYAIADAMLRAREAV